MSCSVHMYVSWQIVETLSGIEPYGGAFTNGTKLNVSNAVKASATLNPCTCRQCTCRR